MLRNLRFTLTTLSLCALLGIAWPDSVHAATIVEMSLGDATTDIEYFGGTLHTVDDGNLATDGDQDTGVLFLNFVDGYFTDILSSPLGSLTLAGLTPSPAGPNSALLINGATIIQNFTGGTLDLWDQNNVLLLSGNLGASALTGALGNATGGLFQTSFGNITGGALMPYVDPNTFLMSMNFTSIKTIPGGQTGLQLTAPLPPGPPPLFLNVDILPFRADATVDVEANVPEPAIAGLMLAVALSALTLRRRIAG
jgi:hypothetical protein